jgi:hypothetical protein
MNAKQVLALIHRSAWKGSSLKLNFRFYVFSEVLFWWAKSFGKSSKKPHTPLKFIGNSSACAFLAARVRTRALRWEGQDD